ncbi:hypothetical protein THOM_0073 [Trachipleistophora hominis]|uniref:Uncharacterized protein n=1 Tax=Trachipleistophora hominis TaxID=72359 RepID=L7JZR7_TRAHO|nr:hypothetical protein THOM_0073 [Trachipleistophora hominis]
MSTNLIVIGHTDKNRYATTDTIVFFTRVSNNAYGIKGVKLRLYCHLALKAKSNVVNKIKLVASSDKSAVEHNECRTMIKIPSNAAPTVYEKYLCVYYTLSAVVHISRTSPIVIERRVFIYREPRRAEPFCAIGAFKGITFPSVFVSID